MDFVYKIPAFLLLLRNSALMTSGQVSANYQRIFDFSWSYLLYVMLPFAALGGSRRRYWHWMGDNIFPAANLGFLQRNAESQCLMMRKDDLC